MGRRHYWLSIVLASLLSFSLMLSAVSYAAAAGIKSAGSTTVTRTFHPTDFYWVGYQDGEADGMSQCKQGANVPVVWRNDPRQGYNAGYRTGLTDGFRQAGCAI